MKINKFIDICKKYLDYDLMIELTDTANDGDGYIDEWSDDVSVIKEYIKINNKDKTITLKEFC